jgi:hypothetical protein
MTPKQVVEACIASDIPFDQIIEEFSSWTHISVPNGTADKPRRQALIIDNKICRHGRSGQVGDRMLLRVWIERNNE